MSDGNQSNWKTKNYMNGAMIGLAVGMLGAYLYNRAREEEAERGGGEPSKMQTGQLLSIALAILSLIRQIAESGKSKK
jgi:hypothetical protein